MSANVNTRKATLRPQTRPAAEEKVDESALKQDAGVHPDTLRALNDFYSNDEDDDQRGRMPPPTPAAPQLRPSSARKRASERVGGASSSRGVPLLYDLDTSMPADNLANESGSASRR